jgi:hypothetical protein
MYSPLCIGNNYSEWDTLIKGVPQGSILKNTKKIEKIQERALRFIYED